LAGRKRISSDFSDCAVHVAHSDKWNIDSWLLSVDFLFRDSSFDGRLAPVYSFSLAEEKFPCATAKDKKTLDYRD
jgi:hypothetical protein